MLGNGKPSSAKRNKSPKGHCLLTLVQWLLLLKFRFLSKWLIRKFVKSLRTANNRDISIQDTRMHSVCCYCIPISSRSLLEKEPLIDLFLRRPGSTSGRIWPEKPKRMPGHDYFIPTKFGQHPSICSVGKSMCSHTYTCINDPPFLHLNKNIKKIIKIFQAFYKCFI